MAGEASISSFIVVGVVSINRGGSGSFVSKESLFMHARTTSIFSIILDFPVLLSQFDFFPARHVR